MPPTKPITQTTIDDLQTQANKIQTNLNRSVASGAVPQIQPTVSAKALSTPTQPVTVPQPVVGSIPSNTLNVARNVARDTNGFIAAQTEEAKQLKDLQATYGALSGQGSLSELFQNTQEEYGVTPASLKELKDINLQLTDIQGDSDLRKTRIEGAAGQTLGQAQREVNQEDRENAVRSATLASRAAVLQGNIETATALAKDAVNIAFQDRTLEATNLLNQINMVQGQVDDQTAQLLEQEKRGYEAELAAIEEVKTAVSNAMVNGASQQEMSQLTDPNVDDVTKLSLAQSITARGANQMRDLSIEEQRASIANSYSAIADRKDRFDLDLLKFEQATVDAVNEAKKLATTEQEAKDIENEAKSDKALGMFAAINELSNHPGLGGSVGLPSPVDMFAEPYTGKISEFRSEVDRLANTLTLENMDLLKGPATDKDVEIVAKSMSRLKNMNVTDASYRKELQRLQDASARIIRNVGATPEQLEYYGITDMDTLTEADAVWGDTGSTTNIDFNY